MSVLCFLWQGSIRASEHLEQNCHFDLPKIWPGNFDHCFKFCLIWCNRTAPKYRYVKTTCFDSVKSYKLQPLCFKLICSPATFICIQTFKSIYTIGTTMYTCTTVQIVQTVEKTWNRENKGLLIQDGGWNSLLSPLLFEWSRECI